MKINSILVVQMLHMCFINKVPRSLERESRHFTIKLIFEEVVLCSGLVAGSIVFYFYILLAEIENILQDFGIVIAYIRALNKLDHLLLNFC